jgi:hypothetical protein
MGKLIGLYLIVMLLELYKACPDLFYLIVRKVPVNDYIGLSQVCLQFRRTLITSPTRNIWDWYIGLPHEITDPKRAVQNYIIPRIFPVINCGMRLKKG